MEEGLIRIVPDKEKAQSILKMVGLTLQMIQTLDERTFPSHIIKEYYDVMRELISILLLLDGYKAYGEGAHKVTIDHLIKYPQFQEGEILFLHELRTTRNRIAYDGFFVPFDYLERKKPAILAIITKLQALVTTKL